MKYFETLDTVGKLRTLQILSLECLLSLWEGMCLHIESSAVQAVHRGAREATEKVLDGIDHASSLSDDRLVLYEFDRMVDSRSHMPETIQKELDRWSTEFIGNETQARIDWNARMLIGEIAANASLKEQFCQMSNVPIEVQSVLEQHRRGIVTRASHFDLLEASPPSGDVLLLSKERLPCGESFIYPTIESASEITSRVAFLSTWKELASLVSEAGMLSLQMKLRMKFPDKTGDVAPRLVACPRSLSS